MYCMEICRRFCERGDYRCVASGRRTCIITDSRGPAAPSLPVMAGSAAESPPPSAVGYPSQSFAGRKYIIDSFHRCPGASSRASRSEQSVRATVRRRISSEPSPARPHERKEIILTWYVGRLNNVLTPWAGTRMLQLNRPGQKWASTRQSEVASGRQEGRTMPHILKALICCSVATAALFLAYPALAQECDPDDVVLYEDCPGQ